MGENLESNMLENNVQQKMSPEEITHPKVTRTHTRKFSRYPEEGTKKQERMFPSTTT